MGCERVNKENSSLSFLRFRGKKALEDQKDVVPRYAPQIPLPSMHKRPRAAHVRNVFFVEIATLAPVSHRSWERPAPKIGLQHSCLAAGSAADLHSKGTKGYTNIPN